MKVIPRRDIPGTYVVVSGPNSYNLDLRDPHNPSCDCPSGCLSDRVCKHMREAMAYRDGVDGSPPLDVL